MFSSPPNVQPSVVRVSWTAAGSSDPLVTGVRYALYSQCGAEATFQLIDDDIQGLSYDITTLPSLTQCVLRVVVYSDHCLLDVNGATAVTTDLITTGEIYSYKSCSPFFFLLVNNNYCFSLCLSVLYIGLTHSIIIFEYSQLLHVTITSERFTTE